MYTSILVPIDGSDTGAQSIPVAAAIAAKCGARLHVAMVHDPSMFIPFVPGEVAVPVYDADAVSEQKREAEDTIAREVSALEAQGVSATGKLLEGTVVESLADYALEVGAELTVMTTHGRSGFNRLRLGSVASAYVTRTSTPTLLVRITEAGSASLNGIPSGRLLCPLDGSPFAESILPHARRFAEAMGMQMELLSVTTPSSIPMAPFGTEALLADPRDLNAQEDNREQYLERVAASCPPDTLTRVITDMSVGNAIIDVTREESIGVIAIATHGRGGIMRLVLGSVANEVLKGATVPTLVYKPDAK